MASVPGAAHNRGDGGAREGAGGRETGSDNRGATLPHSTARDGRIELAGSAAASAESRESADRDREPSEVPAGSEEEKQQYRRVQSLRKHFRSGRARLGVEFLLYLLFLAIVTTATVLARGTTSDAYWLSERMSASVVNNELRDNVGFADVATFEDMYQWVSEILLPFLLSEQDATNVALDPVDFHYPNFHNKLLGRIRVRMLRVQRDSCDVVSADRPTINQCYGEWSDENNDDTPFVGAFSNRTYTYSDASELEETEWWGQFGFYGGGGFVVELPLNLSEAQATWEEMRLDGFVSRGIRLLLVDFQTYNPGPNLHFMGRIAFETPVSGGVLPKKEFGALRINRYYGGVGATEAVFEVLLMIFVFGILGFEVYAWAVLGTREYWSTMGWRLLDWINIVLFIVVMGLHIATLVIFSEDDPVVAPEGKYVSLRRVSSIMTAEFYLLGINCFTLWFKIFKYFRFSRRIKFLLRSFQAASVFLVFFFLLFFIVFLGFVWSGYLAFSWEARDFRSFFVTILALFRGLTGRLNYEQLAEASRVYGPLYYIVFQVFVFLILINMFLAIMTDAYAQVREEDEKDGGRGTIKQELHQLGNPFHDIAHWVRKKLLRRKSKGEIQQDRELDAILEEADANKDQRITKDELKDALRRAKTIRAGGSAGPVVLSERQRLVLQWADTNKDQVLDAEEIQVVREVLRSPLQPREEVMRQDGTVVADIVKRLEAVEALVAQLAALESRSGGATESI